MPILKKNREMAPPSL